MCKQKQKITIIVIDSGLAQTDSLMEHCIGGCSIFKDAENTNEIKVKDEFIDTLGHGTAVVDLLSKVEVDIQIYCIKIYQDVLEIDADILLFTLNYINEKSLLCDLILISSGTSYIDNYQEMQRVIDNLQMKGIIIVSAFDNEGTITFPAAFGNVIGVGMSSNAKIKPQVIMNGLLNVVMPNKFYRLRWVSPPTIIVNGSSFSAAYVASIVVKILYNEETKLPLNDILLLISKEIDAVVYDAKYEVNKSWNLGREFVKKIHRAIIFPWNKEIHSIARFHEFLPFHINGFYDIKHNMNLNKKVSEMVGINTDLGVIKNYDSINWEDDFDTFICGHCVEITNMIGRDLLQDILTKCRNYNKKLYAFDLNVNQYISNIHENLKIDYFVPNIQATDRSLYRDGKLYNRLTPVVGIFGTSSHQGKFTLQLELRRRFQKQGYIVEHISSEPSGYLFECAGVYPFGYNSNIEIDSKGTTAIINEMIWEASDFNKNDIIIVGGQSGVVPYSYGNLGQMNFRGYEFLCAVCPDVFVLCVNPHDTLEYILRSVQYLRSFNNAPIAGLVVFPIIYEPTCKLGYGIKRKKLSDEELIDCCTMFNKELGIPTYSLNDKASLDMLFDCVITELS